MSENPIVVIGAGAAGLVAAIHAAGPGRRVLLFETTRDGGRKILISGGGRCNVLPSKLDPALYTTASSRNSMRRMLQSWPLDEQIRFFDDRLGLGLTLEPETGKLFPASNRARDVRDGLVGLARSNGVDIRFGTTVADFEPDGPGWSVRLVGGDAVVAGRLIVATGGLSVPSTGSDGRGIGILRRLGLEVHDTYPALTPLLADPPVHAALAGVSADVVIDIGAGKTRTQTRGGFLFTHRGYSGPAVLDASHHAILARRAGRDLALRVRWSALDADAWDRLLQEKPTGTLAPLVRRHLPQRLADVLLAEAGVEPDRTLSQLRRGERMRLVAALAAYELPWTGDEGYKKAEVTGGGVALHELDPRTMEVRRMPHLHICGEALDAFGPIGGYNFAWAWATGRAAGLGAAAGDP